MKFKRIFTNEEFGGVSEELRKIVESYYQTGAEPIESFEEIWNTIVWNMNNPDYFLYIVKDENLLTGFFISGLHRTLQGKVYSVCHLYAVNGNGGDIMKYAYAIGKVLNPIRLVFVTRRNPKAFKRLLSRFNIKTKSEMYMIESIEERGN